jgi:lysophospholipase L1-like esterase
METGCLAGMFAGGQQKSEALGTNFRGVAERRGAAFLDAGEHIRSSPIDGIHFDPDQHRILAEAVNQALQSIPAT